VSAVVREARGGIKRGRIRKGKMEGGEGERRGRRKSEEER